MSSSKSAVVYVLYAACIQTCLDRGDIKGSRPCGAFDVCSPGSISVVPLQVNREGEFGSCLRALSRLSKAFT